MRITSVDKLEVGDILGKSLFSSRGELLLASGYKLDNNIINLIKKYGFNFVVTMDSLTENVIPEDLIDQSVKSVIQSRIAENFDEISENPIIKDLSREEIRKHVNDPQKMKNLVNMNHVRDQAKTLVQEILDNHRIIFNSLPFKSETGAEYEHAIDTALISILIGINFGYDYTELKSLGASALLHDVGRLIIPGLHHGKVLTMSKDERMFMREHPTFSMKIVQGSDPMAFWEQATVLMHHEHQDGSGFPQGLKGTGKKPVKDSEPGGEKLTTIFRHAEIVGVANAYDSLIGGYDSAKKLTPSQALERIHMQTPSWWNKHVVKALTSIIQVYPVGVEVKIVQNSSKSFVGYKGIIVRANQFSQTKPTILLTHDENGNEIEAMQIDFKREEFMSLELVV